MFPWVIDSDTPLTDTTATLVLLTPPTPTVYSVPPTVTVISSPSFISCEAAPPNSTNVSPSELLPMLYSLPKIVSVLSTISVVLTGTALEKVTLVV